MLKLVVLITIVLIAATECQETQCDEKNSPSLFQGKLTNVDHFHGFFATGVFFYDAINMRFRRILSINQNQNHQQFDVLELFQSPKKRYIVDLKTRECNVSDITEDFRPFAIRPESKYLGQYTIGLGETQTIDLNAKIDVWEHDVKYQGEVIGNETLSFIRNLCLPVSSLVTIDKSHIIASFFDLNLGISNPYAFDIPSECTSK